MSSPHHLHPAAAAAATNGHTHGWSDTDRQTDMKSYRFANRQAAIKIDRQIEDQYLEKTWTDRMTQERTQTERYTAIKKHCVILKSKSKEDLKQRNR